jgi:hypothetical protein
MSKISFKLFYPDIMSQYKKVTNTLAISSQEIRLTQGDKE